MVIGRSGLLGVHVNVSLLRDKTDPERVQILARRVKLQKAVKDQVMCRESVPDYPAAWMASKSQEVLIQKVHPCLLILESLKLNHSQHLWDTIDVYLIDRERLNVTSWSHIRGQSQKLCSQVCLQCLNFILNASRHITQELMKN